MKALASTTNPNILRRLLGYTMNEVSPTVISDEILIYSGLMLAAPFKEIFSFIIKFLYTFRRFCLIKCFQVALN